MSLFAIRIKRAPTGGDEIRNHLAALVQCPLPRDELKREVQALVPELEWSEHLGRFTGRLSATEDMEIVLLPEQGTLSLRPSALSRTPLEIVRRFYERPSEWLVMTESMEAWQPTTGLTEPGPGS